MSIQLSGPGMSQPRFRQRNRGNSKTVRVNFKKHAPSNKALNNKIKAIQSKEELKHVDNYVVYGFKYFRHILIVKCSGHRRYRRR